MSSLSEDEAQVLVEAMPEMFREPLERLVNRRKKAPNEPPDVAIRDSLLESWHEGLREAVVAEFEKYSPTETATADAGESSPK